MGIEIERKFLLVDDGWRDAVEATIAMGQGYLNDAASVQQGTQNVSMRVRLEGGQARLNIKSREAGASRQEFDYPIPVADGEALLKLCVGGRIEKRRHHVRHEGHLWEIDEFLGDNAGLIVAEIELDSVEEAFARPAWLGREVTDLLRYYNLNLASHPYAHWSADEREARDA